MRPHGCVPGQLRCTAVPIPPFDGDNTVVDVVINHIRRHHDNRPRCETVLVFPRVGRASGLLCAMIDSALSSRVLQLKRRSDAVAAAELMSALHEGTKYARYSGGHCGPLVANVSLCAPTNFVRVTGNKRLRCVPNERGCAYGTMY